MSEKKRVYGYVRVSTEKQEREGYGLEYQTTAIENLCAQRGYELVDIYRDEGISGTLKYTEEEFGKRKAINEMLNNLSGIDAVIVANTSRLWRDEYAKIRVKAPLVIAGCDIISIEQQRYTLYPSTASDWLTMAIQEVIDEYDRRNIVARLRAGRETKIKRGGKTGLLCYGYKYDANGKNVEVNSQQADVIKEMFHLAPRWRGEDLAEKLNSKGYTSPRGGEWCGRTVEHILNNPFYIGVIRREDGTEITGLHEPIISTQEWEDAR